MTQPSLNSARARHNSKRTAYWYAYASACKGLRSRPEKKNSTRLDLLDNLEEEEGGGGGGGVL